jgi:hypothetical protein
LKLFFKSFHQWLEDVGEVRTAKISNNSIGVPSKHIMNDKEKGDDEEFPDPFGKKQKTKLNKKRRNKNGESAPNN